MNRKIFIPLQLSFLFVFLLSLPVFALDVGKSVPDFTLKTLDDANVGLSDFRGQLVILKIATTWCPTCRQATDEICDLSNFLSKKNVAVVEVFVQDSRSMVQEYVANRDYKKLQHASLLDDGQVMKAYDVYLIPRILFLDAEMILQRDAGMMSGREIVKQIEKMLESKKENEGN